MQKSDTVQLKTGGYSTVVFGLESPMVECLWNGGGKRCRDQLFIGLLEEVSSFEVGQVFNGNTGG